MPDKMTPAEREEAERLNDQYVQNRNRANDPPGHKSRNNTPAEEKPANKNKTSTLEPNPETGEDFLYI